MINTRQDSKGFTLIEITLAVIIIVMLSTLVLVATSGSRTIGRDTKRMSDLNQVKIALEAYREDYDHYPYSCGASPFTSFDDPYLKLEPLCGSPGGSDQIGTLAQVLAPYLMGVIGDPALAARFENKNDSVLSWLDEHILPPFVLAQVPGPTKGYFYSNTLSGTSYCFIINETPESLDNFPSAVRNPYRCGGVSATSTGQCGLPGTGGTMSNSIYIGKGQYAGVGC